ncbi:MAG: VOC family protein [Rhodospirillaceae bacterium]|nr:VOC family protein [Rhodospirillaceae bacterium]
MKRRDLFAAATLPFAAPAWAQTTQDHSASKTPGEIGLTGPLHTITLITPDLPGTAKMYRDALGMDLNGPITMPPVTQQTLARAWGIPADLKWSLYVFRRPTVPLAAQIRVVVTETPTPGIRKSWNRQEAGPYGMGFPNADVMAWDKHIASLGFKRATPEIERFPLKRPDGTPYDVLEATFDGPDFLRSIAISRRDGMSQVGDVDPQTGRGGPAYATQVVADMDAMVRFLTTVLDYEVRTDRMWKAYEVPFRFITAYAKGVKNGHIALAAYDAKDIVPGTNVPPAPPNRGMAMWSLQVQSLSEMQKRIAAAGLMPTGRYTKIDAADLGPRSAVMVRAPNGFVFELFEKEA